MKGKLLFVSPKFYDYQECIQNALEQDGWQVNVISEAPGFWGHLLRKLSPQAYARFQKRRFDAVLSESSYDFLLFIRGWTVPATFPTDFRVANPAARLVMYQWDSKRNNNYEAFIPQFDACYSFDRQDCEQDSRITYKPLFYKHAPLEANEILDTRDKKDLIFIAGFQKERYLTFKKLEPILIQVGFNLRTHIYIKPIAYLKLVIQNTAPKWSDVKFGSMKNGTLVNWYKEAVAVLDICNANQTGLTMRTIETLGNRRLLITNNKWIKKESFYTTQQVEVFEIAEDLNNYLLPSQIQTVDVTYLSVTNWLKDLFK